MLGGEDLVAAIQEGVPEKFDDLVRARAQNEVVAGEAQFFRERDVRVYLLKCRDVTHGCYVHALKPSEQLRELVDRLQLAGKARPLTLCLHCNLRLVAIDKASVLDRLPPSVAEHQSEFRHCPGCSRVYWQGDHYRRMNEMLDGWVPELAR